MTTTTRAPGPTDAVPGSPPMRPRDAATLIIIRNDGNSPRILMGRRHVRHAFMPDKYVFPGGRRDAADCRVRPFADLLPEVRDKLLKQMKGRPSPSRARGLAMAAVRETFEESGLLIGRPHAGQCRSRNADWQAFLQTGYAPDLSPLRLFARAITPPGRPRRFDARFFIVDAVHVANLDAPVTPSTTELLDTCWLTFAETLRLDLPQITRLTINRLHMALEKEGKGVFSPGRPVHFQYKIGRKWRLETL